MCKVNLKKFFSEPSGRQRQYEALRAIFLEGIAYDEAAKKFGYKINTLYTLAAKTKSGKLDLFPEIHLGPRKRNTSDKTIDKIIKYRKRDSLSTTDFHGQQVPLIYGSLLCVISPEHSKKLYNIK